MIPQEPTENWKYLSDNKVKQTILERVQNNGMDTWKVTDDLSE